MNDAATSVPLRRRWFRFSLRTLLVFTLLVSLLMGWIVSERRQSAREQEIARYFRGEYRCVIQFAGAFNSKVVSGEQQPLWRQWMNEIVGERIVFIGYSGSSNRKLENLEPLAELSAIKELMISSSKIQDLAPLAELTTLTDLVIQDSPVHDISPLSGLVNLNLLTLRKTNVRNLAPLASAKNLEQLLLLPADRGQVDDLQKALPNCKITYMTPKSMGME